MHTSIPSPMDISRSAAALKAVTINSQASSTSNSFPLMMFPLPPVSVVVVVGSDVGIGNIDGINCPGKINNVSSSSISVISSNSG